MKRLSGIAVAAFGVAAAGGQTTMYLTPTEYTAEVGQTVAVRAEVGQGAVTQRSAWPTERVGWLFVRAAGTQTNREDIDPAEPNGDSVDVVLTKPGVTLIGLDAKPEVVVVPGEEFNAFRQRTMAPREGEVLTVAIADADQVSVRRVESGKALVRVGNPDGRPAFHSAVAQSKTGQIVEIRPLADPTMVAVGSDLPVRAYTLRSKRVGVKMLATCLATGQTREALTDSSGSCHFRIDSTGVWRIEFHEIRPLGRDSDAEWVIYSATLTFEVTRPGAGK